MAHLKGTRIGGRGCPECGSHLTKAKKAWVPTPVSSARIVGQVCEECGADWVPCTADCRGYHVDLSKENPVQGCKECGVPSSVARKWPESYAAVARALAEGKLEAVR